VLYIVATPIGNLDDISLRALKILKEVDFILAEDTRKTITLIKHFGIEKPIESFFDHNERFKTPQIVQRLKAGENAALVSDAGTPTISDPGFRLVRECKKEKITVVPVPGASSLLAALAASSAPREKFVFLGFLPKKEGERKKLLGRLLIWDLTAVFLESPQRINKSLTSIREVLGDRKLTIARELTKKFEEILETNTQNAIEYFIGHSARGEFTIIVHRAGEGKEEKNNNEGGENYA
jgi:16S rRNA (cytidine1402-2'-O)-methyltransferase